MKLQLLWTAATPLRVCCELLNYSEQGYYAVCKDLPYIFIARASNFIHYYILVPHVCLCSLLRYFILQVADTRYWLVNSFALLLTRTSNTDRYNSAESMQTSVCVRKPKEYPHQVYVCTSSCWKKAFIMQSEFSLHKGSRCLLLSFTLASAFWPITLFHTHYRFQRLQESWISYKFRVQFTCLWAVYLYQTPTVASTTTCTALLLPVRMHSSTQFSSWVLTSIPTPAWTNLVSTRPV